MKPIIRVCVDRRPTPRTHNERLALLNGSKWQPGDALHVRFLDGIPEVQEKVKQCALEWCKHANIQIYFSDDPQALIRISFKGGGSWSYIGTDCKTIPAEAPTMNFGWLTPESEEEEYSRVVLHEFGHALGCIHEHQSPTAGGIPWNKDAVYAYYGGAPNFWSKEEVDQNVFNAYSAEMTSFSQLDPQSIMMYPIPKDLTIGGFEVGWNKKLSQADIDFIHKMYP